MTYLIAILVGLIASIWLFGLKIIAIAIGLILFTASCLCGIVALLISLALMGDLR